MLATNFNIVSVFIQPILFAFASPFINSDVDANVTGGGGGSYHVTYPMVHLMLSPSPTPVERQTPVRTLIPATSFADGNKR